MRFRPFAFVAGHLLAAESGFRIFGDTVDEDHTGFKPRGNTSAKTVGFT
jgi:hypothetical protein